MRVHEHDKPKTVMEAQPDNGFVLVSEDACEAVLTMKGKMIPEGNEDEEDRRIALTVACITAIKQSLSAEDVSKNINTSYIA